MSNVKLAELADALFGASNTKYVAVNRGVIGRRITPGEHPWVMAFVEPSSLAGWWWTAVLEYGGVMTSLTVPTPAPSVPSVLARMGVTSSGMFTTESAEPSSQNRWLAKPAENDGDNRSVYFIQADNGLIKIGVAASPRDRLRTLRTMSPVPLRLALVLPGRGAAGESELHARFAEHRSHGEWFHSAPELISFIQENK